MFSENWKVFGGDFFGDGDGEFYFCQFVDLFEVFWFLGEVFGGFVVMGMFDDDVLDVECVLFVGMFGVVLFVGEFDLYFIVEFFGYFVYLVDGCQGCFGDIGDEVGVCFKVYLGDFGFGFGNVNVSKNCFVRVGSLDSLYCIYFFSKDEDGIVFDDVDLVDGGG